MRSLCAILAVATALAAAAARAEAPAAKSAPPSVDTQQVAFDVYRETVKVGRMCLKVTTVRDTAILEHDFAAAYTPKGGKPDEAGFETQEVYKGGPQPRPVRVKASTRVGTFKLMEGTLAMAAGGAAGGKIEVSGYADKDKKPFEKPLQTARDVAVPEGMVLSFAAFLYYGPKLLPEAGQVPKVTLMDVPDDIDYPEFVNFKTDCVLSRAPAGPDGRSEIALQKVHPGGNVEPLVSMALDKAGKIVEAHLANFTLRPPKDVAAPPAKPAATK